MTIPTCPFTPDSANYSVPNRRQGQVFEVALDGGQSATRLDKLGATSIVNVTWQVSLDKGTYDTLENFVTTTLVYGTLPFNCPLVLGSGGLKNYVCKIVPDTYGIQSVNGDTYVVAAQLRAQEV